MNEQNTNPIDSGSFGWAVLGFCIPLVGLILFLVWRTERPISAKKAGIGAIVGVVALIVFYIILAVVGFSIMNAMY